MCDEQSPASKAHSNPDWRAQAVNGLNRRQFGAIGAAGAAAALAACAGIDATTVGESGLTERNVIIETPDGMVDAFFVHPAAGKYPAIICWPDIAGLRDAFRMMARRTAEEGYAVLVVNPYYRDVPAPQFDDFAAFRAGGGFDKVAPWRGKLKAEAIMSDAAALTGWLDRQDSVDTARGIGNEGYCMGGPFTVWTAAAVPGRVKAGASFHGGGLVGDSPTSPINMLDASQASHLIAIAQDDHAKAPEELKALRKAAQATGTPAEIEVYAGDHGWTVLDSPAYDREAAERAYARKIALYRGL